MQHKSYIVTWVRISVVSDDNTSTVVERGTQTSLTFKNLHCYLCTCGKQ